MRDERLRAALDGIAAGLAAPLAAGDVGRDRRVVEFREPDLGDVERLQLTVGRSDTADSTRCVRPDSRRSMASAARASAGFPNTSSPSTTSVSAPITSTPGLPATCSRPAPAFSRATRRT